MTESRSERSRLVFLSEEIASPRSDSIVSKVQVVMSFEKKFETTLHTYKGVELSKNKTSLTYFILQFTDTHSRPAGSILSRFLTRPKSIKAMPCDVYTSCMFIFIDCHAKKDKRK